MRTCKSVLVIMMLVGIVGCGDEGAESGPPADDDAYDPMIDSRTFSTRIDNPFLPWLPGMKLTYVEDEVETIEVTVMDETRTVMGVECVVVHDQLTDEDGTIVEDTYDWYAQDADGTVWYFGEDTTEYDEDGTSSTEGSWEAGVDGALPGIVMPAEARAGNPYRQEYYAGEAEDMGQIIAVDADVEVPAGSYSGCLVTKDWSALSPKQVENKVYCPGIGNVKAELVEGGTGLEVLTAAVIP